MAECLTVEDVGPDRFQLWLRSLLVAMVSFALLISTITLQGGARAYAAHAPIAIDGSAELTPANGVVSGDGTPADPYVIEGWEINASSADGIRVRNVDDHLIIRGVFVHSGLLGFPEHAGVFLYNTTNTTVESSYLSQNSHGVFLYSTRASVLSNNSIADNNRGVYIWRSNGAVVTGNSFTRNGFGLSVEVSERATITANNFERDGIILEGSEPSHYDSHLVGSNWVNGRPVLYRASCSDVALVGGSVGQIIVASCSNVLVSASPVSSTDLGILLAFVQRATVARMRVAFNDLAGIRVQFSSSIAIVENEVEMNAGTGIEVSETRGVRVAESRVAQNANGISVVNSPAALVSGNTVTSNPSFGIGLFNVSDAVIRGNLISGGSQGILSDRSSGATIQGNTVTDASVGISVSSTSVASLSYQNNLAGNVLQAYDDRGPDNSWDNGYPVGGNYWSDHSCPDNCSGVSQTACPDPDGIGDVPYWIDLDSVDRYPLVSPALIDIPPVAIATPSKVTGIMGEAISFDSGYSTDDFGIASRRWLSDGGRASDAVALELVFATAGWHSVNLTVTDTSGQSDVDTAVIEVVERAPGHIRGRVIDPESNAVPGASVVLKMDGVSVTSARSGAEGDFEFANLTPSVYTIVIEAEGFLPAEASVEVNPANVSLVTMQLSRDPMRVYIVAAVIAAVVAIALVGYLYLRRRRQLARDEGRTGPDG